MIARVIEIIGASLRRGADSLPPIEADSSFSADLGCDGIDLMTVCMALEDELGIDLPEAAEHCETVGELARMVEGLVGSEAA
jgi:acyl carrier protein